MVIKKQSFAVRRRGKDAGIRKKNLAVELFDLHIPCDIGAQRPERVRQRGSAKAGMKFFRDGAAAHHFTAFENQRLEAALGQIESGDERVVASADKHDPLSQWHDQLAAFERDAPDFQFFRMTWLANRPFAPMMPPPGCVHEPHI